MDKLETECTAKLPSFPALSRDIYQSFYSLSVRRNEESGLSDTAKQFNSHMLDSVMNSNEYKAIKSVCEGRQLPAYDAATEFVNNIANSLDDLLREASGDKGSLNTLEKLASHEEKLKRELDGLLQNRGQQEHDPELDQKIIDKANMAVGKLKQVEAVARIIDDNLMKNQDAIGDIVATAMQAAAEVAEITAQAVKAWGTGDNGAAPEQMALDRAVVDRVRKSATLSEVAKHLGRFREMMANARKNGYAYGRGEKYALESGNDLNRVLTSEFSMLAAPATMPLFLRKYQNKKLQQYKRREPVYKGAGDIIMCLDESDSAKADAPWGKAVALALLDAAMAGGRKFALIHFSGNGNYKTDVFLPGGYNTDDVFAAVETFLDGGTNFETPLSEALRLIEGEGFENADIVFVTDGVCALPQDFNDEFKIKKAERRFKVTGVVMDVESPGMGFSLKPFCEDIYRTSELSQDGIVESILSMRI
jgi:uncharacterized protein with von Willebrand factor type A (vWA) domain